jgi:hypothetical protein
MADPAVHLPTKYPIPGNPSNGYPCSLFDGYVLKFCTSNSNSASEMCVFRINTERVIAEMGPLQELPRCYCACFYSERRC